MQRRLSDTMVSLGLQSECAVDWANFFREVCEKSNAIAHTRQLGNGEGRGPAGELPLVVIQLDECLMRGRRLYNRGRMLLGENNPTREDRDEWDSLNAEPGSNMDMHRNYGRRITGPWVFGLLECTRQEDLSYISGEIRLFVVERRDAQTLIPIIRQHVSTGSMIWSDEWRAYARIGSDDDGLQHESVNHSENFIAPNNVHTQNIEGQWHIIKNRLIKGMRGTSSSLLNSHLHEYMWRSRNQIEDGWEKYIAFLDEIANQNIISW